MNPNFRNVFTFQLRLTSFSKSFFNYGIFRSFTNVTEKANVYQNYKVDLDELNKKYALPVFDLNDVQDTDLNKIKSKSPLQKMFREGSIKSPFFEINDVIKNKVEIQENVNLRKCVHIDIENDIITTYNRIQDLEERISLLNSELDALYLQKEELDPKEEALWSKHVESIRELKKWLKVILYKLRIYLLDSLMLLPNSTCENAKKLKTSSNMEDNIIETLGEKRYFDSAIHNHIDIANNLQIFRQERMHEFTGSRSYFLTGKGAQLEQALINYTLDKLNKKGFMFVSVPNVIRDSVFDGAGLPYPYLDAMVYNVKSSNETNYNLAGTAEIGLCTYFANHSINLKNLPAKVCAVSTCYRKETDSRKDPYGLFRVHQFSKVEMFGVTANETTLESNQLLEEFVEIQKELIEELGLHARVMEMPLEELGLPAHRKIDIEVWFPGRNEYAEVTSASNCTDFQSRRLQIMYNKQKQFKYAHTVNATACAITRIIMALLETGQNNHCVKLPSCLSSYMNNQLEIRKEKFKMQYIGLRQGQKKKRK